MFNFIAIDDKYMNCVPTYQIQNMMSHVSAIYESKLEL